MASSVDSAERGGAGRIVWTISRRLLMVVVLTLAFILSASLTIYMLVRIGDTRVPELIGKPATEAQSIAEKAGLRVKVQHRSDSTVPANMVIETRPGPRSSVKKDSSLTIIVSAGQPQKSSRIEPAAGSPGFELPARAAASIRSEQSGL